VPLKDGIIQIGIRDALQRGAIRVFKTLRQELYGLSVDGAHLLIPNESGGVMMSTGSDSQTIAQQAEQRLVSLARVMGPPGCQWDGTTVARY